MFDKSELDADHDKPNAGPQADGLRAAVPTGILFDQWSRYASLAAAVRAMLPDGGTVLDVGSGELTLLRRFLPQHQVTFLDPLLIGRDGEGLIGSHFADGVVADGSFDAVVCVDVLEHVPAAERRMFLQRMIRASRRGVVVSAPFHDVGGAKETDDRVQMTYRAKHGRDYPWLAEHELYGLPDLPETRDCLEGAGLRTTMTGNGHVPWLNDLLSLHVVLLDESAHRPLLKRIGDRFAAELFRYDHLSPVYRQILVADRRGPVPLPQEGEDAALRGRADAAWASFRAWVDAELSRHVDDLAQKAASPRSEVAKLATYRKRQKELEREVRQLRATCREERARVAQLYASLSWKLTRPLRMAARLCSRGVALTRSGLLAVAHRCVRFVPKRLAWRIKSIFFAVFSPLLKNTHEYREFQAVRRSRQAVLSMDRPEVVAGHSTLEDVLVFGVINWAFRIQRPQQLALEMARRGHRLFYLAPGFLDAREPGYQIRRVADDLPLYEVHLCTDARVSIYEGAPDAAQHAFLAEGLRRFLRDIAIDTSITLVDHPGWVSLAALVPRTTVVYDCMDNHHGFAGAGSQLPADEKRLLEVADAVVVTSDHLDAAMRPLHGHVSMVRNACDPSHFAGAIRETPSAASMTGRPVIGYFGAMAEWFDTALVRHAAEKLTACDFLLVGADTANVAERLRGLGNVRFTGEIPYEELPPLVGQMDVLFIPFVIDELTLATNPVKAYEALAAGKPVVATAMPELMQTDLAPFVRIGATKAGFVQQLSLALAEAGDAEQRAARIAFAAHQSWSDRAATLLDAVARTPRPRFCVVIVLWNGVELSRRCVQSVLDDRAAPELDVVLVDNASSDATAAWLDEIERDPRVRTIRNNENLGFAAACNQGLAAGSERDPDVLVILNNDIVVTPGWARTIHHHLQRDASIGLIGPVTNNIGNEARVETKYTDLTAMLPEQRALTAATAGRTFDIPVLAFFCVAMPRDVYGKIGGLDENFGRGFFEDDDYCQRVRRIGRRIVCAEDVFVHHELSASFDKIDQGERARLFERNRAYYESKWGPWQRHAYRPSTRGGADGSAAAG